MTDGPLFVEGCKMGMEKVEIHSYLRKRRTMGGFDDFQRYATTVEGWTSVLAGSASAAVGDGVGGILTLSTIDSTNNLLAGIKQTNSLFKYQANTPIYLEACIQYAEANTNAANVAFGVMSSVSSTALQDDGAGIKANCSAACIFKVDGGTVWKTGSSIGTTQTISTSKTTAGGSAYQRLGIQINPISSTIAEVTYFVSSLDGEEHQLETSGGRPGQSKIKDQVTYTGGANMQLFLAIKSGSTTPEVLLCDYIGWEETCRLFGTVA